MGKNNRSNIRIFEERGIRAEGLVLPKDKFEFFRDVKEKKIVKEYAEIIIKAAEEALEADIPFLPLSLYRDFSKTGIRSNFEPAHHKRRRMLSAMTFAEIYEGQGRFIEKILDIAWAMLEESTWILPAHFNNPGATEHSVPNVFKDEQPHGLDIYACNACSHLAMVYYFLGDKLDEISPVIKQRIEHAVYQRGVRPLLEHTFGWMGENNENCNNWLTDIVVNVLLATAICIEDMKVREAVLDKTMHLLDNFSANYPADGACDEGPGYWSAAPGDYFNCLELIEDLTDGKITIYDHPHIKNMGEYISKVNIDGKYFLNFSDAAPRISQPGKMIMRYGEKCGSPELYSFGKMAEIDNTPNLIHILYNPYMFYREAITPEIHEADKVLAKRAVWFPDSKIAVLRESEITSEGFFLAMKGGTNAEAHNHLDVGVIILHYNGKPIFIDPSHGSYNNGYFGPHRYERWYTKSSGHSLPTINGFDERFGLEYASRDEVFDEENMSVSMELVDAFQKEAGIISFRRTCQNKNGEVKITDTVRLEKNGEVRFGYLTLDEPKLIEPGRLAISEGRTLLYNPELEFVAERVENTNLPYEDLAIERLWDRKCLWRIVLVARGSEAEARITIK